MSLEERIKQDMITYMKSKDSFSLSVIRMLKSAMQLEEINKKTSLSDDDVIGIVAKQIKLRNDSISEFEKASREDLVNNTKKEIEILMAYLPSQLTEEELDSVIEEVFNTVKPTSMKDMGLIMKELSPRVKGRADMSLVNSKIKEKLNEL